MPRIVSREVNIPNLEVQQGADPYAQAQRQRLVAEMLRQRANEPIEQHFESGGQNFVRGMTQLGHALLARRALKGANTADQAADDQARAGVKTGIEQLIPQQDVQGVIEDVDGGPGTPLAPGAKQNMAQTLAQRGQMQSATDLLPAHNARDVVAQALLQRSMPSAPISELDQAELDAKREAALGAREDRREAREQRIKELQLRIADAQQRGQDAAALRRELAQLAADNRMAVAELAAGQRGAAAQAKDDAKADKVATGKSGVSSITTSLRDMYDQLKSGGGVTTTENTGAGNVAAGVASSGFGQGVGRLFGTENQSNRNTIKQQRPLLLQAIKEATGMSAQQMNSNVELKLFLEAATDPSLDFEANIRALDKIDELYGDGVPNPVAPLGATPPINPAAQPPTAGGLTPAEQAELDQLRRELGGG